ncbi:hypothetical protein HMPREF0765_4324 [Sphingobacterium spiritivorum ATCC 33300]|uniref:Uncharacterized protein n=1 Tax=Sphingobacterium spiritivorum ATCC 33300 TaxID=525372 RepID=C2G418_SPHSI|nr:hypothetical protein HMPREF0765_4324 [Sphingobacterium spiritivorum ATCC 33300]
MVCLINIMKTNSFMTKNKSTENTNSSFFTKTYLFYLPFT